MSRARDTADTQDNLGGAIAPFVGGKNAVINGGFDIWQRGTSFSTTGYAADRFYLSLQNATSSRQSSGAPIGSQYYLRNTSTASNSATDVFSFLETSQTIFLVGQTVTLSAKVRRNATLTQDLYFRLDKSPTVDAGIGASWTTLTPISGTNGTSIMTPNSSITTGTGASDWTTITRTYTIPNDGTANSLRLVGYQSAVASSGAVWEIAQIQLELGNVVTPFARAGGSIGGELALCQRYYWRAGGQTTYQAFGTGIFESATGAWLVIQNPVPMRTAPSSIDWSTLAVWDGGAVRAVTGVTAGEFASYIARVFVTIASGGTQFRPVQLFANNSTSAYVGFSAEL
jgi:hypothetical protein